MTDLLKLAEKLGILICKCQDGDTCAAPVICTDFEDTPIYVWEENDNRYSFVWSLDGPDLGNVAAVVKRCLMDMGFVVESRGIGRYFNVAVYKGGGYGFQPEFFTDTDETKALIEAAGKALGVEG